MYAARRVAGLNALEALELVPYAWLLRFRTFLWYSEGLGASARFSDGDKRPGTPGLAEAMAG